MKNDAGTTITKTSIAALFKQWVKAVKFYISAFSVVNLQLILFADLFRGTFHAFTSFFIMFHCRHPFRQPVIHRHIYLYLRHVEPTAVFRGVMDFQFIPDTFCFGGRKRFILRVYTSKTSSIAAANSAFPSGGMHHS
jgi:hypothetical protein